MKFLFYTHYYPPEIGAPPIRLHSVARELKKLGHEVEIITTLPNYPAGKIQPGYKGRLFCSEEIDAIPVHRFWLHAVKEANIKRLISYLSFQMVSFLPLVKKTFCYKPDYLFVESPPIFLGFSGVVIKRLFGTKLIFNIADLWPHVYLEMKILTEQSIMYKLLSWLEIFIYKRSDILNVVVPGMREYLISKGMPTEKIHVLRNGVDPELFSPGPVVSTSSAIQKIEKLSKEKQIVLYAGNHGKAHGLMLALEAAEILADRSDLLFLFVGDGSAKSALVEFAGKNGLTNVVFLDPVPVSEIADLFRLCTVSLALAIISGIPSKLFPALSTGKAVIYVGSGDGADLIRSNECGVSIQNFDPAELAEVIALLVDNPSIRNQYGKNGRELIKETFTWREIVSHWLDSIEDFVSSHRA